MLKTRANKDTHLIVLQCLGVGWLNHACGLIDEEQLVMKGLPLMPGCGACLLVIQHDYCIHTPFMAGQASYERM